MMKRNVSDKTLGQKQKKKGGEEKKNRFLISINVLGSAGPLRLVVNEDEVVAGVIGIALKAYAREGRLPALVSDVNKFFVYCSNGGFDALDPWKPIGSLRGRTLCCARSRCIHK